MTEFAPKTRFAERRVFWYSERCKPLYRIFGYEFSEMASSSVCFLGCSVGFGGTFHDRLSFGSAGILLVLE